MAATNRLFQDFIEFTLSADPGSGGTTLNGAGLAALIAVADPDFIALTVDPDGVSGDPEIVHVTAHTGSATSATVARGQEGTTARAHAIGTTVRAALTAAPLDVLTPQPALKADRNSLQSIATSGLTDLVFDGIEQEDDERGEISYNTSTGEFTLQPGWWLISTWVGLSGFGAGELAKLTVGGLAFFTLTTDLVDGPEALNMTGIVYLSSADTGKITISVNSGSGSLSMTAGSRLFIAKLRD